MSLPWQHGTSHGVTLNDAANFVDLENHAIEPKITTPYCVTQGGFKSTGGQNPRFPIDFAGHHYNIASPVMFIFRNCCKNNNTVLSYVYNVFGRQDLHFAELYADAAC